jgi:uncharacterized protein (DUF983 family)
MAERKATWDARARVRAIRRLMCPRCGRGPIFASAWTMHRACPACGLVFEREPGYFTGAMYFSYALGIPIVALGTLVAWLLLPGWPLIWLVGLAWLASLPLTPAVFRYSRVLFLHFDRMFDPDPDEPTPG